jgi:MFS family permease
MLRAGTVMAEAGKPARLPRPFEDNYGVSLAVAILSLVPFIIFSTAIMLYYRQVMAGTGAGETGIWIAISLSEAGYAFGALLGGYLAQRFPQRLDFLACEGLFAAGAVLMAIAGSLSVFGAGVVLIGFATGMLLVVALPPVIQRFPPEKLPITVAAIDIGFFGAVALGPMLGGVIAAGHDWRWFHAGLAGFALLVLTTALFTLPDQEAPDPNLSLDRSAIALGLGATVLPFWAAGELFGPGFHSLFFIGPLTAGVIALVTLLLVQYHKEEPLSPVKPMWKTHPVVGTVAAMVGGGAFVTFVFLAIVLLTSVCHQPPLQVGLTFWPLVPGVMVTATLLGVVLRSRGIPLLVLAGMMCLLAGGGLLLVRPAGARGMMLAAAGLLGLGGGATVSPGLYLAALPQPSRMVGRIFALVELVRSIADYILAPVMYAIARVASDGARVTAGGIRHAVWATLLVTGGLTAGGIILYLAGRGNLPRPDIKSWLTENCPAFTSPPLLAALRNPEEARSKAE